MFLVDGRPLDKSNWMRYMNSAASPREQNLVAYMRHGNIYYRTHKAVGAGEELLVSCGTLCAQEQGQLSRPHGSRSPVDGEWFAISSGAEPPRVRKVIWAWASNDKRGYAADESQRFCF